MVKNRTVTAPGERGAALKGQAATWLMVYGI